MSYHFVINEVNPSSKQAYFFYKVKKLKTLNQIKNQWARKVLETFHKKTDGKNNFTRVGGSEALLKT